MNDNGPIDLMGYKNKKQEGNSNEVSVPKITPGTFEFHLLPVGEVTTPTVEVAEGYLKFGPTFIAVVDGPEDQSNVLFAIATQLVMYVKRLGEDNEVQATLAP